MYYEQPPLWEDISTLLAKVQVIHDIVDYNCTLQMGKQYQVWIDKHLELVKELEQMLADDLLSLEKP